MKNLLLLAFATILLCSCEDLEKNDSALQAKIDNNLFQATSSRASQNDDGSYLIQGTNLNETMTLKISSNSVGTYALGGPSGNYAIFENIVGAIYTTDSKELAGEVVVTDSDPSINAMSGTFNFTAIVPGVDTIAVHNGVFFEVRYTGDDGGDNPNDGTMLATVDDNPFNPFTINAFETGNSIGILGANNSSTVYLKIPMDIENGNYDITDSGFSASYTLDDVEEDALSGTIIIISHNIIERTISGTFLFLTENHTIEQGQFSVNYQ